DPRAALALVQLRRLQDRRPHRSVAGPGEAVEQQRFELGQPRELIRQPVARTADLADRAFGGVGGGGRGVGDHGGGGWLSINSTFPGFGLRPSYPPPCQSPRDEASLSPSPPGRG